MGKSIGDDISQEIDNNTLYSTVSDISLRKSTFANTRLRIMMTTTITAFALLILWVLLRLRRRLAVQIRLESIKPVGKKHFLQRVEACVNYLASFPGETKAGLDSKNQIS
jgi:hypothetical protein